MGLPFLLVGALKIIYDLWIFAVFGRIRLPDEENLTANKSCDWNRKNLAPMFLPPNFTLATAHNLATNIALMACIPFDEQCV